MRALATATTSNKPTASSSSTRPSSRQSTVSSSSQGKLNSLEESRKQQTSGGNVLIATTTTSRPRFTKSTTPQPQPQPRPIPTPRYQNNTTPSVNTAAPRRPLQARDKNAAPTRPTYPLKRPPLASTASTSTTMSANSKSQPTSSRAPTPSLSAGAARAMNNKQPLTPKIASRGLRTPQHQTVSVTTPLSRTPLQRSESASSYNKEEVASPVDAFLNNNITPRSGSRQSRVSRVGFDSAGSTPNGTPNLDSHDTWETRSGLGITPSASKVDDIRRPVVTFSSPAEARTPMTRQDSDSKFFYASDATRSQTPQPPSQRRTFPLVTPQQQQKTSTFFYANTATRPESPGQGVTSAPSTPVLATPPVQQDNLMSKFVYANSTRDSQPPPARPNNAPRSGSVISTASKAPPRLGTPSASGPGYAQQRPISPVKLASFSSGKTSNNPPLASPRTMGPVPSLGPASASTAPQRRSIPNTDTPTAPRPRPGHSRHGSVATISEQQPQPQPPIARLIPARPSSGASSEASSPSNLSSTGFPPQPTASSAAGGFVSLIQAAEDFTSQTAETTPAEDDTTLPEPGGAQSPSKSSSQQDAQLTELVATARRERKVQDLEITNASLEAINRTLERQLRKQTAEIRRYRRLSRSGRLSLNSASGNNRVVSDGSVVGGALARAGLGLDDLSEEEDSDAERDAMSHEEEDDDDEDYDLSPSESGDISPGSRALRNARQRRRDEQRLQLDLSKHQQLLVDSQKINQSLRRCLGWTEELIKDGRRALEYKVRVSEVELGGRVLAPEEVEAREKEEAEEAGEGEGEAEGEEETLHAVTFDLSGATDEEEVWKAKEKEKQDRDSGVDLPADGG